MSMHAKLLALPLAMLGLLGVPTAAQAGTQMYSGSLIIEGFGRDYGNPYYPTPYFNAVPLGADCNTQVHRKNRCGSTTIQQGAPLTGMGTAATNGMGGFTVPASALARTTSGSFAYYFPYIRSYTYATLKNQAGSFFAGGGPGYFSFNYKSPTYGMTVAMVGVTKQGVNQFGGTMQLLGAYRSRGVFAQPTGLSYYTIDWRFDILGANAMTSGGVVTAGYTATATGKAFNTKLGPGTRYAKGTAFPWTTGTVTATATGRGPIASTEQRRGYDHRTSMGLGTIQLVTPLLTHWTNSLFGVYETVGIGVLRVVFAETVVIDGCDTEVSNTVLSDGSTISDRIEECADNAKNHGAFERCVSKLGDRLQKDGVLTGPEKDRIISCAAEADIP